MAKTSGSSADLFSSESSTAKSHERITWLKRYGSDELLARSIASRTKDVSTTLMPAKTIFRILSIHTGNAHSQCNGWAAVKRLKIRDIALSLILNFQEFLYGEENAAKESCRRRSGLGPLETIYIDSQPL